VATDTDTIEYLKTVAEQAESDARKARIAYNDALRAAAPFHVGDVAVAIRGHGVRMRPCKILLTRAAVNWDRVKFSGNWQNKDGSWSKIESDVWGELHPTDWEPTPVPARTVTKDML
jgi:hypothetical protein